MSHFAYIPPSTMCKQDMNGDIDEVFAIRPLEQQHHA